MKITLKNNGEVRQWLLEYKLAGRRRRFKYGSKEAAEAEGKRILAERKKLSDSFVRYTEAERYEMVMAFELARAKDKNIVEIVQAYGAGEQKPVSPPVERLAAKFLTHQEVDMNLAQSSMKNLSSIINRFSDHFKGTPINEITREGIQGWLAQGRKPNGEKWHTRTKNGYLTEVKNFFNWCAFNRYIREEDDPAATIRKAKLTAEEMKERETRKEILTVEEARAIMDATVQLYPEITPRVATLLFAGTRPDIETAELSMEDIMMDRGLVRVRARFAKDRQARYIKMTDNLKAWLEWSFGRGYTLPVTGWKTKWKEIRESVGLFGDDWPKDCSRHSFASYYLELAGEEETIKALGHGNYDMLFQNYRTLVEPEQGRAYFGINPNNKV